MVSNAALAAFAVLHGLHVEIRCASRDVQTAVAAYVQRVRELADEEERCARAEARPRTQFWLAIEAPKVSSLRLASLPSRSPTHSNTCLCIHAPQILGDVVESILGAIYVDDGFAAESGSGVDVFFERTLRPFFDAHIQLTTLAAHPSTSLFELLQAAGCTRHAIRRCAVLQGVQCDGKCWSFTMWRVRVVLIVRLGVLWCVDTVVVHETVLASAVNAVANTAIRKAAAAALDALTSDPGFMAEHCDCRARSSENKKQGKSAQAAKLGYHDN
jgi:endoribonuclease Dicer